MEKIPKSRKILFWSQKKIALQNKKMQPSFKEGEIWWVAVGENVGIEINGKTGAFSRPVLILKKYSKEGFFGVPLTSQTHSGAWYFHFTFMGNDSYAALTQGRIMSVYRLYENIGEIPKSLLKIIQRKFCCTIQN